MRWALLLFLLGALGCSDPASIFAEAPGDVELVGLIRVSGDRVVDATGLRPVPSELSLSPTEVDSRLILVGYAEADLRAAVGGTLPPAEVLRDATLYASGRCEPGLPEPIWIEALDSEEQPTRLEGPLPNLSAAWIGAACAPFPELGLDISCADYWCERPTSAVGNCGAVTESGTCGLPSLSVTVDPVGQLCIASAGEEGAFGVFSEIDLEAELGYPCLVRAQGVEQLALDITSIDFISPLGLEPRAISDFHIGPRADPQAVAIYDDAIGFAADLLVVDQQVLLVAGEQPRHRGCAWGAANPPLWLMRYGLDGTLVSSTTISPCLGGLEPDPEGRGFWGAHGPLPINSAPGFEVVHYDDEGGVIESHVLRLPDENPLIRAFLVLGRRAFITLGRADGGKPESSLIELDLGSGEWTVLRFEDPSLDQLVRLGDDLIGILDDNTNTVEVRRVRASAQSWLINLPVMSITQPFYDEASNTALFFGRDPKNAGFTVLVDIRCVTEGGDCGSNLSQFFLEDHMPIEAVPWPGSSRQLAVLLGVQRGNTVATVLSRFDLDEQRYAPLAILIADSLVPRVGVDGNGTLWAVAAEEGRLLRIRLRQ